MKKGLDNRSQDKNGRIRKKNGNTKVKTLQHEYGENFLKGYNPEATLSDVLKETGKNSLSELLKKDKGDK